MTESQFADLCREICHALQMECASALADGETIVVDGAPIALFFDAVAAPGRLFCYVDMGAIDERWRTQVYASLLTRNLLSGAKTNGVYALDPLSGNAVFIVHFSDPEQLDGAALAHLLRRYAAQAAALRGSLSGPPGQAAAAAPAGMGERHLADLA